MFKVKSPRIRELLNLSIEYWLLFFSLGSCDKNEDEEQMFNIQHSMFKMKNPRICELPNLSIEHWALIIDYYFLGAKI